jgi:hypothetical protein
VRASVPTSMSACACVCVSVYSPPFYSVYPSQGHGESHFWAEGTHYVRVGRGQPSRPFASNFSHCVGAPQRRSDMWQTVPRGRQRHMVDSATRGRSLLRS